MAPGMAGCLSRAGSQAAILPDLLVQEIRSIDGVSWWLQTLAVLARRQSVGLPQCSTKSFAGNNDVQGAATSSSHLPSSQPLSLVMSSVQ